MRGRENFKLRPNPLLFIRYEWRPGLDSSAGGYQEAGWVPLPALFSVPSGLLTKLMIFCARCCRNVLAGLKDDNVARTMPTYKPAFRPTTSS